jgi:hypothetical protein
MRCSSKRKDGQQCGAAALRGQPSCHFHSLPGVAAALGSKGGRRRAIYRAEDLKQFAPATTAAELAAVVAQTLSDVRDGRMDAKTGNAVSCLATCLLTVIKADTLEARLAVVEKFIAEGGRGSRRAN